MSEQQNYITAQRRNSFSITDAKFIFGLALILSQLVGLITAVIKIDIISLFVTQLVFFLVVVLYARKNSINLKIAARVNRTKPINYLLALLIPFLMVLFAKPLLVIWKDFLTGIGVNVDLINISDTGFMQILAIIVMGVGPMVGEEFIFRGTIASAYAEKHSAVRAIVISMLFFTVTHANPVQLWYPMLGGMIMGYVYFKTNSIIPTMIMHLLNNSGVTFFEIFATKEINSFLDTNQWIIMAISGVLLVGVLVAIYFINKDNAPVFGKNAKLYADSTEIGCEAQSVENADVAAETVAGQAASNKDKVANALCIIALVVCILNLIASFFVK